MKNDEEKKESVVSNRQGLKEYSSYIAEIMEEMITIGSFRILQHGNKRYMLVRLRNDNFEED